MGRSPVCGGAVTSGMQPRPELQMDREGVGQQMPDFPSSRSPANWYPSLLGQTQPESEGKTVRVAQTRLTEQGRNGQRMDQGGERGNEGKNKTKNSFSVVSWKLKRTGSN